MHAVYLLQKTSLTTPEAAQHLARALKVPATQVSYAGLKDKHASTSQHVTVTVSSKTSELALRQADGRGWSARFLGWSPVVIDAAAIERNHFTIVIRDIATDRGPVLDRRVRLLASSPGQLRIVNYFGDQRFGSARHGHGFAAPHLVRGEFEQALRLLIATPARKDSGKRRQFTRAAAAGWGDWTALIASLPAMPERRAIEALARPPQARCGADSDRFREAFAAIPAFVQSFCIEAYQSFLWNAVARALVQRLCASRPEEVLRAHDDFGEMLFPAASVSEPWGDVQIPQFGPETTPQPMLAELSQAVLASEGLTMAQLRIPGLRRPRFGQADRPFMVTAEDFALSDSEPDDLGRPRRLKRTAKFSLPRGAYATVVLRALGQD